MELPREPERGDSITADWARKVARALRALRLTAGPGIRIHAGPDGTTVSAAPGKRGGAESFATCPAVFVRATGSGTGDNGCPCQVYGDGPHNVKTGEGTLYFPDIAMGDPNGEWFVAAPGMVFETGGSEQ